MITSNRVTCPTCVGRGYVGVCDCPACKGTGGVSRCESTTQEYRIRAGHSVRCDLPRGHEGPHRRVMTWDDRQAISRRRAEAHGA